MGDANGWFYRKDWFDRADIKAADLQRSRSANYNREKSCLIAQFSKGEIDGGNRCRERFH